MFILARSLMGPAPSLNLSRSYPAKRSDCDSPHPIFVRVVLAENLAGLLRKTLVTDRRRFIAALLRLRPIRSRVLIPRYAHRSTLKL